MTHQYFSRLLIVTLLLLLLKCTPVFGQFTLGGDKPGEKEPSAEERIKMESGPKFGQSQTVQCVAGIKLVGGGADATHLLATIVVPMDWPEQKVSIVKTDIPASAKVTYRDVGIGSFVGAKMMEISVPKLLAGKSLEVLVTFEVTRLEQLAPLDTIRYMIPKAPPKDVKVHLLPSPKIESNDKKFRKIFKEITENSDSDWDKVEAVYKYAREKVKYSEDLKMKDVKGALAALKDGDGDCEDLCALFVAICRAGDVPARTVFVKGHCYAEFYLVDAEKKGYWFPCQVAGSYAFGSMPDKRYIVQKGDNFRIDKEQLRFVKSVFTGEVSASATPPKYEFVQIR